MIQAMGVHGEEGPHPTRLYPQVLVEKTYNLLEHHLRMTARTLSQ